MSTHEGRLRPVAVTLRNFRGIESEQTLRLAPGLTVLVGDNGSGKSSFLTGFEWCLYGHTAVGKSSSGIAERGDWLVAHRRAVSDDVQVTVTFQSDQGTVELTRRVSSKGKGNAGLELILGEGEVIQGAEVENWLAWHQIPDWQSWKNSFFQHQDLARGRLTEAARRTELLSGMLGLGSYRAVHETLKRLRSSRLGAVAEEVLAAAAQLQDRAAERPHADLRDWLSQLKKKGIETEILGKATLSDRAAMMLSQAREQAQMLGMVDPAIPSGSGSARELLSWAADWPAHIQSSLNILVRDRQQLDRRIRSLEAAQDALRPARLSLQDLMAVAEKLRADSGSPERLDKELEELGRQRVRLDRKRVEQDELGKLIGDALELMTQHAEDSVCPVCSRESENLRDKLESKVQQLDSRALAEEQIQVKSRIAAVTKQAQDLKSADEAVAAARKQVSALEDNVRGQVDAGNDEPVPQMLTRWREARAELDLLITSAEDHVRQHREEREVVSLIVRVLRAQTRTEAGGSELSESPAFRDLQRAVDEAAAFACDIHAVGALARELEDKRSQTRITEINQGLEQIYGSIVGRSRESAIRIKASRTAAAVSYQLVGQDDSVLAGSLNQASVNALSLACLLASAQSRIEQGLPQFVLLDEPAQNLDDAHSQGLASVLADFAKRMPVVVATLPGQFCDALEARCEPDFPPVRLRQAAPGRHAGIVR